MKISKEFIQFIDEAENWKEAIKIGAQPLLTNNYINQNYVEAMITNVEEMGDYIVVVPFVAMPHARPEKGAFESGLSFLILKEPVVFGVDHLVRLVICLSTKDNTAHLELLQVVSELIDEEEKVDKLINSSSVDSFVLTIEKYLAEAED